MSLTWRAEGRRPARRYRLMSGGEWTRITVLHCGHPTALWPYYITYEDLEEAVFSPNGRGFRLLKDAKERAVKLYLEGK